MAKTLMGAVASNSKIEGVFEISLDGGNIKKVGRKETWPDSCEKACETLIAAASSVVEQNVKSVQIYTGMTDKDYGGDIVDIETNSNDFDNVRIGDDETVPAVLATARDDFKAALQSALDE